MEPSLESRMSPFSVAPADRRVVGLSPRSHLTRVVFAVGVLALSTGCGFQTNDIRALGDTEWGVSAVMTEASALLGSQLWCSEVGDPVTIESVVWEESEGVEIVDFSVVTQTASADRVGFVSGELAQELPRSVGARDVEAQCENLDTQGAPTDDFRVSYIVVQLRLSDPQVAGSAQGLIVASAAGFDREPVSVVLCPAVQESCEAP